MKKGSAIGIGVAIIAVVIIVGIASIPDEVLLENPSLEMSDTPTVSQEPPTEQVVETPIEESVIEEPTVEPVIEEPPEEPVVEEAPIEESEEESEGETIKIEIIDGVGSQDR